MQIVLRDTEIDKPEQHKAIPNIGRFEYFMSDLEA